MRAVHVRATVNLPGLSAGEETMADAESTYIKRMIAGSFLEIVHTREEIARLFSKADDSSNLAGKEKEGKKMSDSQQLIEPRNVKFHDGAGKAFLFLVTKEDEGEHLSGAVWCDDPDNTAGLTEGWNARVQIGRADDSEEVPGGASWSPF